MSQVKASFDRLSLIRIASLLFFLFFFCFFKRAKADSYNYQHTERQSTENLPADGSSKHSK